MQITASAPTRVDIAGGTLDLWPIHQLLDEKATVNVAITLDASVTIARSPDVRWHFVSTDQNIKWSGTFEEVTQSSHALLGWLVHKIWKSEWPALTISTTAKSPAGAGLGGSSCLGVAITGALWRARETFDPQAPSLDEQRLVATVRDVEARLIHTPTGVQDYWGAVRGGINVIDYPPGHTDVTTIPSERLPAFDQWLICCYSGRSRASAINNWEIFKKLFDRDANTLLFFNKIGGLARQCANAVLDGNLERALQASREEWEVRKQLWPAIVTPETESLDQAARKAGAMFSRVCGAGGGGVMAIFASPDRRAAVEAALKAAGGQVLDAHVARQGLEVKGI